MLSTEQESLHLDFALKEKQFACIQKIADGRDVMGILPIGYGKPSYILNTILPSVLDMLHYKHLGWHMVLVMPPDDGSSQNMQLWPDYLIGAFTKPSKSRISETSHNLARSISGKVAAEYKE